MSCPAAQGMTASTALVAMIFSMAARVSTKWKAVPATTFT
jgi:hypothetical protein